MLPSTLVENPIRNPHAASNQRFMNPRPDEGLALALLTERATLELEPATASVVIPNAVLPVGNSFSCAFGR